MRRERSNPNRFRSKCSRHRRVGVAGSEHTLAAVAGTHTAGEEAHHLRSPAGSHHLHSHGYDRLPEEDRLHHCFDNIVRRSLINRRVGDLDSSYINSCCARFKCSTCRQRHKDQVIAVVLTFCAWAQSHGPR